MTDSKTPKNDQLRAMRERNEAERLAKIKAKPAPAIERVAIAKAALK